MKNQIPEKLLIKEGQTRQIFTAKEPAYQPDIISAYALFRDQVYNPTSVLYPCCNIDASPAQAFRNVTFVDINEDSIKLLKKAGLNAINTDITSYKPREVHDLLILMNPTIATPLAAQHIPSGAHILANDYHGNASYMFDNPEGFTLTGALDESNAPQGKPKPQLHRDPSGFFEPVKSLDELKFISKERYDMLEKLVKSILSACNAKSTGNLKKDYANSRELFGADPSLPAKRIADIYIFKKR